MIIESCCETIAEALLAEKNGANRIEFCSQLEKDGLTPKTKEIRDLLLEISIPVRIMIRPNPVFIFDQDEEIIFFKQLEEISNLNIDGIVCGYLQNKTIDRAFLNKLGREYPEIPVTFHKAIDFSQDILASAKTLNDFQQIDYILTSGGCTTAWEGRNVLLKMNILAKATIMGAGKITKSNFDLHHEHLQLEAYHGRRIV